MLFLGKILREKPWDREEEDKIECFERNKAKKRKTRLREREKSRAGEAKKQGRLQKP